VRDFHQFPHFFADREADQSGFYTAARADCQFYQSINQSNNQSVSHSVSCPIVRLFTVKVEQSTCGEVTAGSLSGNSEDKLRHPKTDAYLGLLNKQQISNAIQSVIF